ncbi:hypothetical protein OXPF_27180 [Oxobacter pfennigii]|uniref:Lipoprotein n=1 Tax=Oxobacter pfennigii TaxID=36849 RepID=A0A0P8WY32_9CLOT|nr:hypothetical protein [Oxobacter pfennigii]KPU43277.1 hypothetical protein OXPF_27180 [Oxobacter pfennigii]
MKTWICIFVCICLLSGLTACYKKSATSEETLPVASFDSVVEAVDKKYYPKFMDIEEGKTALKPLVYGSIGWSLLHRQNFLFAVFGRYVLRYNINENKVDKVDYLGESYNNWPFGASASSNGRYSISYSFDFYGEPARNYFLIDFETETAELICDIYSEEKVDIIKNYKIPDEIKGELEDLSLNPLIPDTGCSIEVRGSEEEFKTTIKDRYFFS